MDENFVRIEHHLKFHDGVDVTDLLDIGFNSIIFFADSGTFFPQYYHPQNNLQLLHMNLN